MFAKGGQHSIVERKIGLDKGPDTQNIREIIYSFETTNYVLLNIQR